MILTFKYRIKDASSRRHLNRYARAVNRTWNYCCEVQRHAQKWNTQWPSHYGLTYLTAGSSAELGLHSDTVGEVCRYFAAARSAKRWCPRWRGKHSLGWVPFRARWLRIEGNTITYLKRRFCFWKSRDFPTKVKTGAFVQDARGRWYVTFQCEVADDLPAGDGQVGIDLGLKTLATLSDGGTAPALQHFRQYERQLGIAQRARNKRRVAAIHAKIANARRHHLHEQSTRIANDNSFIAVGNVSPSQLGRTRMAKSIHDASWAMLKQMLRYKAARRRAVFVEVDERWTSQTCSSCGVIPDSSPKGMGALGIRLWECSGCGARHDRDVNAAINILRAGLKCQPLAEGIAA